MKNILTFVCFAFIVATASGQNNALLIAGNVRLPKDSIIREQLMSSLNGFLLQKEKPNKENAYVLKSDLLETSDLLDETKEIEKNETLKDDNFYKGYLTGLTRLRDTSYIIQVSYLGVNNNTPALAATFTFIAKKMGNKFYFNSPLKQNTASWKSEKYGSTTVFYKNKLNTAKAKECFKLTEQFDKKLSAPSIPTLFYCCDNFQEAIKLLGVDFKADHSGHSYSSAYSNENDSLLILDGVLTADFTNLDPHDLWHSRLHKVVSSAVLNKPVDEGTAYLYGGSWGLTWKQILEKFKTYAAANPNADWIALYNESKNFDEKAKYPLNVDFVINALLVQKIEKEKGFSAVLELVSCGKQEPGNANYFDVLKKITGITKADFNANIWMLIKAN